MITPQTTPTPEEVVWMYIGTLALVLQAATAVPTAVQPDTTDPRLRHPGRVPPIITAVRVDQGPDLDGRLDDAAWRSATFNVRSVRTNLVIRWEYMPGSTLFLVWNHNRSGFSSDPTIGSFDQFGRLWDDNQRNTFLIKINYWISL